MATTEQLRQPAGKQTNRNHWALLTALASASARGSIGDKIKQADGTTGVVANVTTVQQPQEMFNLTVDTAQTFYVGNNGWLVHNTSGPGCPIWSSRPGLTPAQNALRHWNAHKADFPHLNNSVDYVKEANTFLNSPPSSAMIGFRSNGEKVVYDPVSNAFAVSDRTGAVKSYFKVDAATNGGLSGVQYFFNNTSY